MRIWVWVAAAILAAACGSGSDSPRFDAAPDPDGAPDAPPDAPPIPVAARQLDLLFVIDDSPAMADRQTQLDANYELAITVLETIQGGLPNVHLAVVTTDLGTKGAADAAPGAAIGSGAGACAGEGRAGAFRMSTNVDGGYIIDVANTDGSRTRNYSGTLGAAFKVLAHVGAAGCDFPQPLEAARRALESAAPAHQGFLRPGAYLAIVFITAGDDCSLAHSTLLGDDFTTLGPRTRFRCNRFGHVCDTNGSNSTEMNQTGNKGTCSSNESSGYLSHVADYVTYFRSLTSDPDQVIVAAVASPVTPYDVELYTPPGGGTAMPAVAHSCSYISQTASVTLVGDPSVRISELLAGFPSRNTFSTICQDDLSGVLTQVAQLLAAP